MPFEWVTDFLASLALTPNVAEACRQAGITRKAAYDHRAGDEHFAKLWDDALAESTDELVGEAYRRAKEGVDRPVFYKGEECGKVREYSDQLAIFLLKAHRPAVYGDRLQTDLRSVSDSTVTHFYVPENGRDDPAGAGGPPAAGPTGDVPLDPG